MFFSRAALAGSWHGWWRREKVLTAHEQKEAKEEDATELSLLSKRIWPEVYRCCLKSCVLYFCTYLENNANWILGDFLEMLPREENEVFSWRSLV